MFLLQLQYEWKHISRNSMAWLLLLFLGTALAFAAYNGRQRTARQSTAVQALKAAQDEKFASLEAETDSIVKGLKKIDRWWLDPTSPLVVGMFRKGGGTLVVEPGRNQALAAGMSDLQPEAYAMLFGEGIPRSSSDYDNPARLALGAFDLAFVIVYLLPLFVIAFTYNLLSSEREQGTLALLLSQPIEGRRVFVFKMLARFVWLSLLTTILWAPVALWTGIEAGVAIQTLSATLLYSLFWFVLALAVNLQQRSSAFNVLACIGAWLLLVVVMPAAGNMVAEKLRPVPSRAGYENALRTVGNELEKEKPAILDAFYTANPKLERKPDEEKTTRDWWLEEFHLIEIRKERVNKINAEYDGKSQSHTAFARQLTALSPAMALYDHITGLAGTNRAAQLSTAQQLKTQAQTWMNWFQPKYDAGQTLTAADYPEIRAMLVPLQASGAQNDLSGLMWMAVHLLLVLLVVGLSKRRQMVAGASDE